MVSGALGLFQRFSGRIQPEKAVQCVALTLMHYFGLDGRTPSFAVNIFEPSGIFGFGGALCTIVRGSGDWSTL
jgi:hypothetical protein